MTVHTFEGYILVNTGKAIKFQSHFWDGGLWFPISQTEVEVDGDMTYVIKVKDWLAKKRGIFEFTYYSEEEIERMATT